MEILGEKEDVKTEKVLPCVIKVEESNCLLCGRNRKFYSCRSCNEVGHLSFFIQLPNDDPTKLDKKFPGFICGQSRSKVEELQKHSKAAADLLERTTIAGQAQRKKDKLLLSIIETKRRIELLKHVKKLQVEKMRNLKRQKAPLESAVEQLKRRSQRVQMKKTKITEYMATKKNLIQKAETNLAEERKNLVQIQKHQVRELITHIFPIVGMSQDDVFESSDKSTEEVSNQESEVNILEEELAEARRLSFVHGRWIYDQGEGPDLVRISIASNKACAPADGDYSACENWLRFLTTSGSPPESSSDLTSSSSSSTSQHIEVHSSQGASIYAALSHATQLVNTLRKILLIHMPYKHHFRQFMNPNMTVQEFLWNVHRLNGNVIALCLHYGVEPNLIHPLHTLPNLQNAVQMFLHNGDSITSSTLSPELITSIEEALNDSSDPLPDDDEDKMEELLSEWENSLIEEDWEALAPKLSQDPTQPQYTSAAPFQSLAQQDDMGASQGLMSSAVAWMTRGWWNR